MTDRLAGIRTAAQVLQASTALAPVLELVHTQEESKRTTPPQSGHSGNSKSTSGSTISRNTSMMQVKPCKFGRCSGTGKTLHDDHSVTLCPCYQEKWRIAIWGGKQAHASFEHHLLRKNGMVGLAHLFASEVTLEDRKKFNAVFYGELGLGKTFSMACIWDYINQRQACYKEAQSILSGVPHFRKLEGQQLNCKWAMDNYKPFIQLGKQLVYTWPDLRSDLSSYERIPQYDQETGELSHHTPLYEVTVEKCRKAGVLYIDDLGGIRAADGKDTELPTAHVTEQIYRIFRERSNHLRPTVISSNNNEKQLEHFLGIRVWDAFVCDALIVPCAGKNLREKE